MNTIVNTNTINDFCFDPFEEPAKTQMEMALQEMNSHPEFLKKVIEDEEIVPQQCSKIQASTHQRATGWQRKRMYKKQLIRRFLSLNPAMKIAEMPGCYETNAIYDRDYKSQPYNPRKLYNINMYEKLRISPAGDIRACKKKVVHCHYQLYMISPSDIPFAKEFTNRRIRSKTIHEDDYIPSGPAYYKKKHSRMISTAKDI